MISLRRKTRESLRHERATVLQELGAVADADPRPFWRANQERAAELRRRAQKGGGHNVHGAEVLGLVTKTGAGGTQPSAEPQCSYCNDQAGGCWFCGRG